MDSVIFCSSSLTCFQECVECSCLLGAVHELWDSPCFPWQERQQGILNTKEWGLMFSVDSGVKTSFSSRFLRKPGPCVRFSPCYQLGLSGCEQKKLTLPSENKAIKNVHLTPVETETRASSGIQLRAWQIFFLKGPDSKYFVGGGPSRPCRSSQALLLQHKSRYRQYINE